MLKVEKLKLWIVSLLGFDHYLHLATVRTYKLCSFLNQCIQLCTTRLQSAAIDTFDT